MEINLNYALQNFRKNLKRNLLILVGVVVLIGGIFFSKQLGELLSFLGIGAQTAEQSMEIGTAPNTWQAEGLLESRDNLDQAALDAGKLKIDFQAASE